MGPLSCATACRRQALQLGGGNVLLDLLEASWPLLPVVHDDDTLALVSQELGHLFHLLLSFFDSVYTDVGNARDTSTHGSGGAALGVLDGDDLRWLDTELLACVEVDLWVWLGGWWVKGSGGTVDVLVWEVVVDANLLDGGDDTGLGAGGDDAHLVALLLGPLHHLWGTWAWVALLSELGGDTADLHVDVVVNLLGLHLEVVDLLELVAHAAEVLSNECLEELVHIVDMVDVVLLEDFVAEVGAGLEGAELGESESVVAVKETVGDLGVKLLVSIRLPCINAPSMAEGSSCMIRERSGSGACLPSGEGQTLQLL